MPKIEHNLGARPLLREPSDQGHSMTTFYSPGRRQSKTLLTINNCGSKVVRNSVLDCHLLPDWRQMQSKTLFLPIFNLHSSIVLTFSIAAIVHFCGGSVTGRMLDLRLKGHWFETHPRHCVVSLSKTLYPIGSTGSTQEDRKLSRHGLGHKA